MAKNTWRQETGTASGNQALYALLLQTKEMSANKRTIWSLTVQAILSESLIMSSMLPQPLTKKYL
jgi:hypothetical protein